jgi:hypothetical protein
MSKAFVQPVNQNEPSPADVRQSEDLEKVSANASPRAARRSWQVPQASAPASARPARVRRPRTQFRRPQFLRDQGLYESQEEAEVREEVMGRLAQLVREWIRGVAEAQGQPVEEANARVFTFGSYRLGVHGPGARLPTRFFARHSLCPSRAISVSKNPGACRKAPG